MAEFNDSGCKTFEADEAIPLYARVKLDPDGKVTKAGLADKDIGTATREAFAAGDKIAIKLRTAAGTHKMIASEAVAAGATLYTESDGEVQDTAQATAFQIGTALNATTADQDIVEVLYNSHGDTAAS